MEITPPQYPSFPVIPLIPKQALREYIIVVPTRSGPTNVRRNKGVTSGVHTSKNNRLAGIIYIARSYVSITQYTTIN
jgi:hypothetical protein